MKAFGALVLVAMLVLTALPSRPVAQSDSAVSFIIVYVPERVDIAFATDIDLARFFLTAEYDEAENAFVGRICVSGSAEVRLTFAAFATEQAVTLFYAGEPVEATAQIVAESRWGDADDEAVLNLNPAAAAVCPEGSSPVRLAIRLPERFRDIGFDRSLFAGSLELFVRPI